MIRLLNNNLLVSPFVLFIFTFLLRVKGLINPVGYTPNGNEGPIFNVIFNLVNNPYLESIFVSALIFVQAYLVNRLVLNHNLMRPPNYLSAYFFIILASLSTHFLAFHPVILTNVFIILGLGELFKIYKMHKSAIHIYNAGFLFAVASLIYLPITIFYVACSLIILVLRSYNIIERLQLLLGFITPIYLICIWYFLKGNLQQYLDNYVNISFQFPSFSNIESTALYVLVGFLVLIFLSVLNYRNFIVKKGIEIQKKIDSLYWFSLFTAFALLFSNSHSINHLMLLVIPLSIFISMFVLSFKQSIIAELFSLLILLSVPLLHFIL